VRVNNSRSVEMAGAAAAADTRLAKLQVPARQRPVAGAVRALAAADEHLRRTAHSTCVAERRQPQAMRESKQRRGVARCCSCVRSRLRAAEDEHAHAHAHDWRARRGGHGQRAASARAVQKPDGLLWLQTGAEQRGHGQRRAAPARSGTDTRTCARCAGARRGGMPRRQSADRSAPSHVFPRSS
jgi:hypothetical protein